MLTSGQRNFDRRLGVGPWSVCRHCQRWADVGKWLYRFVNVGHLVEKWLGKRTLEVGQTYFTGWANRTCHPISIPPGALPPLPSPFHFCVL